MVAEVLVALALDPGAVGLDQRREGADEAGAKVCAALPRPTIAFFFDCMARKIVLGPRYKDELRATFARLGPDVPKVGFYTFGELSPVEGTTMHHEETFTIALLQA